MKIKQYHWHHFSVGCPLSAGDSATFRPHGFVLFAHLNEAYASVQYLYNEISAVAWVGDSHRWCAISGCGRCHAPDKKC